MKLIFIKNDCKNAIIEGIEKINTKFFCIINADGSMGSKCLEEILIKSENKNLIFGLRYINSGGSDDDTITFLGNKFFSFIVNLF